MTVLFSLSVVFFTMPATLPAAAAGVFAGCALALHDRVFHILPALAALLVALLLQIGSNLANDVFDYEIDLVERPERPLPVTKTRDAFRSIWIIFSAAASSIASVSRRMPSRPINLII